MIVPRIEGQKHHFLGVASECSKSRLGSKYCQNNGALSTQEGGRTLLSKSGSH